MQQKENRTVNDLEKDNQTASSGNASNPPAEHVKMPDQQLLDEKAEKYLRESGNIEDLPDAEEEAK